MSRRVGGSRGTEERESQEERERSCVVQRLFINEFSEVTGHWPILAVAGSLGRVHFLWVLNSLMTHVIKVKLWWQMNDLWDSSNPNMELSSGEDDFVETSSVCSSCLCCRAVCHSSSLISSLASLRLRNLPRLLPLSAWFLHLATWKGWAVFPLCLCAFLPLYFISNHLNITR